MEKKIVIMNFSGVYEEETFARNPHFVHLDCSHLAGTDCYCDADGEAQIRRIIGPFPAAGIHFIDSGDYHYVTKFWTDKIATPFSLVLLDHHTDMQPPLLSGMLSCGDWVKDMIDGNHLLQHVYILGVPREQAAAIPASYGDKVMTMTDEQLHGHSASLKPLDLGEHLYISIDKDVLDTSSARTDWDQGILTLTDLKRVLSIILRHEHVIGIDICGECPVTCGMFDPDGSIAIDDKANSELLELFKRQELC